MHERCMTRRPAAFAPGACLLTYLILGTDRRPVSYQPAGALRLLHQHEELIALDEGVEDTDLLDGRHGCPAAAQVEGGSVLDALHLAVQQLPVVKRVALVGAAVRQSEELPALPDDHQLLAAQFDGRDAVLCEIAGLPCREPGLGHEG